jgi:hypothetical protein
MSALICQRASCIDRRDKRSGDGHARARRHWIEHTVGPVRPRSFRVRANYLDALNASRVRIHRKEPKALGFKLGCGFTRHLLHQGSPTSGYRPLGGGAVTAQAQAGPGRSIQPRWRGRAQRRRGDRMRRRLSHMTEALAGKTCTPCRGAISPLTREQAKLSRTGPQTGNWRRKLTVSSGASGFAISASRLPSFQIRELARV